MGKKFTSKINRVAAQKTSKSESAKKGSAAGSVKEVEPTNDHYDKPDATDSILARFLHSLSRKQVFLILFIFGFIVFSSGLHGEFQGDDTRQIVENTPVHSISNIGMFFRGGTFYTGLTPDKLEGGFYRPMMSTSFSIIYTLFGDNPFYFHAFQLLLHIFAAFLLFLFFQKILRKPLALLLGLIYLVHPLNSQSVYAIPSLQDPLFFIFGISALLLIVNADSNKKLVYSAIFLLLAMLTKEASFVFVLLAFSFITIWKRKYLKTFSYTFLPVALFYLIMRVTAVGLFSAAHSAPIGRANILERLLTIPSIHTLYFTKLIAPIDLASSYYWVVRSFSIRDVLVPFMINLAVVSFFIYLAIRISAKDKKALKVYLFFSLWTFIGLVIVSQLLPLDMTASLPWMYMPLAGILGMLGVAISILIKEETYNKLMPIAAIVVLVFGIMSYNRGSDWQTEMTVALKDIQNSTDNYRANSLVAVNYGKQNNYERAVPYAEEALKTYPNYQNYYNLGLIRAMTGEYEKSIELLNQSIPYASVYSARNSYLLLSQASLLLDDKELGARHINEVLNQMPNSPDVWTYLAILEASRGNKKEASIAIDNAIRYGASENSLSDSIKNEKKFTINVLNKVIVLY